MFTAAEQLLIRTLSPYLHRAIVVDLRVIRTNRNLGMPPSILVPSQGKPLSGSNSRIGFRCYGSLHLVDIYLAYNPPSFSPSVSARCPPSTSVPVADCANAWDLCPLFSLLAASAITDIREVVAKGILCQDSGDEIVAFLQ